MKQKIFSLLHFRSIASKENLPFSEYWDFLDCHIDLSSKSGLEKLESFLRHKADKTSRCRTVAKPNRATLRYGVGSNEEIKRRLSFDNDNDNNTNAENDTRREPRRSPPHVTKSLPSTWSEGECYCRCGQLLGNCEDCSVDIDIDKLIVSFSLCCNLNDDTEDSIKNNDCDNNFANGVDERVNGDLLLNSHTNNFNNEFDSPVPSTVDIAAPIYIHG